MPITPKHKRLVVHAESMANEPWSLSSINAWPIIATWEFDLVFDVKMSTAFDKKQYFMNENAVVFQIMSLSIIKLLW